MISTKDIFRSINTSLLQKKFNDQTVENKKQIFLETLKDYTFRKLLEFDFLVMIDQNVTLRELLFMLGKVVPESEQVDFFNNFTHSILVISSGMQEFEIIWYGEDTNYQSKVEYTEDNQWDTLRTAIDANPLEVVVFALDEFENNFLVNKKQLVNKRG